MDRGRILVVDPDPAVLRALHEGLTQAGFEAATVRESTLAVPRAMEFAPDLILVNRNAPLMNGAEVIRALLAFPRTAQIPVAFLTEEDDAAVIVRSVRSGAVDVLKKPVDPALFVRTADLLEELERVPVRPPSTPETQARVLMRLFRRDRREGVLRLNPDTPFEGRAVFDRGNLRGAEFGPARGFNAVEEMLAFEGGVWQFDEGLPDETTDKLVQAPIESEEIVELAGEAPVRVLLVDDDAALQKLFSIQLRKTGFVVDIAGDGREGAQVAKAKDYDLLIADLNMPRLDGWGMLRELRADFRTRETPVIFLSAHDDYRETLKAAQSGAWAYLPKTGRADQVIHAALQALLPRQKVQADLLFGGTVELDLGLVGPRWFLKRLSHHKATGTLLVKDEWGTYRFSVREGAPLFANAVSAGKETRGVSALGALLVSRRAKGTFSPQPPKDAPQFEGTMDQVLDNACNALTELQARTVAVKLAADAPGFEVEPVLYELYRRISTDREVKVARAVCEEKVPVAQLASHLGLGPEVVEAALTDLLRRQVIRFRS